MQNLGLRCVLSTALLCTGFSALAALDKTGLELTPVTNPSLQAHLGEMREVQYLVVNQGDKAHTYLMQPIKGVTQELGKNSYCKTQITLEPGKSCTLSLLVDVSEAVGLKNVGPTLCDLNANSHTDGSLCAQPQKQERLSVSKLPANKESLSIMLRKPISLSDHRPGKSTIRHCFAPVCTMTLFQGTDADGELHVTSTSITTITASGAPDDVAVSYSDCSPYVPGGADCIINFDASAALPPQSTSTVTISGSNTPDYTITLDVLGLGDDYDGEALFQLPSSGNAYIFYNADNADIGTAIWSTNDAACTALTSDLPGITTLQVLYTQSDCPGQANIITGFNCGGADYQSATDAGGGFHDGLDFLTGTSTPLNDGVPNPARCVGGYQLTY